MVQSEPGNDVRVVRLEMSDDSFVRVESLRMAVGYKSLAEFLTDAVEVFGTLLEERARGKQIGLLDKNGEPSAILELPDHRQQGRGR